MSLWSTASFENESADDWFYAAEEAVEPGIRHGRDDPRRPTDFDY